MTAHAPMGTFEGAIAAEPHVERLTLMERECLRLVADRQSSKEIAVVLGIAKTSVDTYCNRARRKLGVADRYEAARLLVGSIQIARAPAAPVRARPAAVPRARRRAEPAIALLLASIVFAVLGMASLSWGLNGLDDILEQRRAVRIRDIAKHGFFEARWFP